MLAAFRFLTRGLRLLPHLTVGLLLVLVVRIDGGRRLQPEPLTQWWNAKLFRILGIRLRIHGQPVRSGHVTVANHVSWLDIPLIAACERTRFVSKSEVRQWPISGSLATAAGTFYLERGKHGTRPLIEQLKPFLQGGGTVAIFPEGTTSDGSSVLPFHARLFAAAIESQRPVQPVAIRYGARPDGLQIAPYIGDDVMIWHIFRLLRSPAISADVTFLPPIDASGAERDALAQRTREAILGVLAPDRVPEPRIRAAA